MMMMTKNDIMALYDGCRSILATSVNGKQNDTVFPNLTPVDCGRLCNDADKAFGVKGRIAMLALLSNGTFYVNAINGDWLDFDLYWNAKPASFWIAQFKDLRRKFNSGKQISVVVQTDLNVSHKYWIRPSKHQQC